MNEYVKRIDDNVLISDYKDGEILQHTDVNAMIDILKQGINANYEDIQKVTNGELTVGEASKLSGASLVKSTDGVLDDSDTSIPTSNVVKKAIQDATPVKGEDYFTDEEVAQIVSASVEAVVSDVNQRVEQNYIEKTEDFDTHVEDKKIEIDTHTVGKKRELDEQISTEINNLEQYVSEFVEDNKDSLRGPQGIQGPKPVKGVDYFTEDDINSMVSQVTKDATNEFNTNATSKVNEYNANATSKIDEFNTNATSKVNAYNGNATSKVNTYNENATTKLNEYNTNHNTKLQAYNTNADTRLQEFNDNADSYNERITANENNITENITNISRIENNVAQNTTSIHRIENNIFESGEATGESINIQDSVLSELTGFRAKAVNSQKTTNGKNLLDFSKYSSKSVYTTIDFTDDVLTVSNSQGTYQSVSYNITELCSQNSGKTLSLNYENFSYDFRELVPSVQVVTSYNDGSSMKYNHLLLTSGVRGKFDIPEDISNISSIMLRIMPNNSSTDGANTMVIEKPMLFLGSNTDNPEYEPFTNGASPNPDFPSQIPVIEAGEDVEFKSYSDNIFDYVNNLIANTNGLKNVINADGSITTEGEPWSGYITLSNRVNIDNRLIDGEYYTLSQKDANDKIYLQLQAINKETGAVNYYSSSSGKVSILVNKSLYKYSLALQTSSLNVWGSEELEITNYYKLERGKVATGFTPYIESNLTTSVPENEFVGATDTTADEFYTEYNEEDKKEHIYLAKNVGRRVLNGTENWVMNYGTGMFHSTASIPTKIRTVLCSHFTYNSVESGIYNTLVDGECALNGEPNVKNIYFKYTVFSTVAEWKAYLAEQYANGNPIIVQYELAEPYVIDLGAVDQLKTWTDVTNILNDSSIPFNMTANYYRNFISTIRNLQINNGALQTELANLESRLSTLETSVSNLQVSQVNESEVVE